MPLERIIRFSSAHKDENWNLDPNEAVIVISTYSMMAAAGERSGRAEKMLNYINSVEWGLLILDEVQVVPANTFQRVTQHKVHCKLGLTATLVREDDKIKDLNHLIGPKLYEANWLDLQKQGYLANVQCIEIWCEMTSQFYEQYMIEKSYSKKQLLWVCNPNKLMACEYLI